MGGSESDAVFDACDLNPHRFIKEVLNAADDLLDGAFQFCLHQASIITGCGEKQSDELAKGGFEAEIDLHLSLLREKLAVVGKESSELHMEIQALEKQASCNNSYDASIAEVLRLYEHF